MYAHNFLAKRGGFFTRCLLAGALIFLTTSLKAASCAISVNRVYNGHASLGIQSFTLYDWTGGSAIGNLLPTQTVSPGNWSSSFSLTTSGLSSGNTYKIRVTTVTGGLTYYSNESFVYTFGTPSYTLTDYTIGVGAPPAPDQCIDIETTNNTQGRQKYTPYVNGVAQATSFWINPGESYTFNYCTDVTPLPTIIIKRVSDGDPPVTDYSRTITGSDAAWHDEGDTGTPNTDDDSADALAGAPPIDWEAGTTAATDEVLKKGFEAIYGISRYDADNQKLLLKAGNSYLVNIQNSATTANTTATATKDLVSSVDSRMSSAVTALNSANSLQTTANSTATTANTKLDSIAANTAGMAGVSTAANQAAAKTEAHTDSQAVASGVASLQSSNSSGQASLGTKLDAIKTAVDQTKGQASGDAQGLYDGQATWAQSQGSSTAAALDGAFPSRGDLSPDSPGSTAMQISVRGHIIDWNPMSHPLFASLASWIRGMFVWLTYAGLIGYVVKVTTEGIRAMGAFQQSKGVMVNVAGTGSTWPAGVIVSVITVAALVVVAGFFITWKTAHADMFAVLATTPWQTSSGPINVGIWLADQFIPLVTIMSCFGLGLAYTTSFHAVLFAKQLIIRAMPS